MTERDGGDEHLADDIAGHLRVLSLPPVRRAQSFADDRAVIAERLHFGRRLVELLRRSGWRFSHSGGAGSHATPDPESGRRRDDQR